MISKQLMMDFGQNRMYLSCKKTGQTVKIYIVLCQDTYAQDR